jgi:molecular chaperone GrpE (heat shock protein)
MTILERLRSGVRETEYCRAIRRRAERNCLTPERQLLEILKTELGEAQCFELLERALARELAELENEREQLIQKLEQLVKQKGVSDA